MYSPSLVKLFAKEVLKGSVPQECLIRHIKVSRSNAFGRGFTWVHPSSHMKIAVCEMHSRSIQGCLIKSQHIRLASTITSRHTDIRSCKFQRRHYYRNVKVLHSNGHKLLLDTPVQPVVIKRFNSTEPTTVYEHILSSKPVHLAQSIFELGHNLTGFHWAGSIVTTTLLLRFSLTFPLSVYAQYIRARVESLQPEILGRAKYVFTQRFGARMKNEKWSEKRAQKAFLGMVRLQAKEIYVRENCHPAKGSILLLVQLPLWIVMSLSLRNMSGAFSQRFFTDPEYLVPEFATEGALWFPDLMVPDPYMVLPVFVGVLNLVNIEMHALHKGRISGFQRGLNNVLRIVSLVMIPVAAYVPSSMALYWTVSAGYGFGQNVVLKLPTVRTFLGIPKSSSDSATPFRDMKEVFQERYLQRDKSDKEETEPSSALEEESPHKKSEE